MNDIRIITTGDGSHSLLNTTLNETYHSSHGAIQESLHVFVKNGFDFYSDQHPDSSIAILEIGFGTGLNVLLTAQRAAEKNRTVHYTTVETYPLAEDVWRGLNYPSIETTRNLFETIHASPWSVNAKILPAFTLTKVQSAIQQFPLTPSKFDIVYFDAFAPSKQPEIWQIDVLKKVTDALVSGGVLVTYCAKGQLKRDLKSLGLRVDTLQGAPGKKEMIRVLKI